MISQFILAALFALTVQATPVAGSITGVVVNASQNQVPVAGAKVVLRVKLQGQFVVAAECISDHQGRFAFDNLPAGSDYIYLPGANRDGIHYPGTRVRLGEQTPHARVRLTVHDTVADPNPLVLLRHNITLRPETDALRVTESLLIDNPTSETYVGRPEGASSRAATFRLSIPSDFRRTTFDKEFYGRQFTLIDGKLVTDVPWTPGQRELAFTYVLPNEDHHRIWQRPLDLPCDNLRIEVQTDDPDDVSCNLARVASPEKGCVIFQSAGQSLPAGHVIHIEMGRLPISMATYGRWLALIVLLLLIAVTSFVGFHNCRTKRTQMLQCQPSLAPKKVA